MHAGADGTTRSKTPGLDLVAREGLLFKHAYTPMAKCAPSRAIILTGRHLWQLEAAGDHPACFPAKFKSWPETLMENGWFVSAPTRAGDRAWPTTPTASRDSSRAGPPTNARPSRLRRASPGTITPPTLWTFSTPPRMTHPGAGFDLFLRPTFNNQVEMILRGRNSYAARVTDITLGTIRSLEANVQGLEECYQQLSRRQSEIEEKPDLTKNQASSQVEAASVDERAEKNSCPPRRRTFSPAGGHDHADGPP